MPSTSTSTSSGPPGDGGTTPAQAELALDHLGLTPDTSLPDYRRIAFGDGWDYDRSTGCNTRERVLIAESEVPVTFGSTRCHPTRGRWRSIYDGLVTDDPGDLQIDHLVPLAVVWRSGGAGWSPAQREAYANDLTDPNTLVAVSNHTNEAKGDSGPDEWLPPDRGAWCTYATRWVEVKQRWHLTVTVPEKAALARILGAC